MVKKLLLFLFLGMSVLSLALWHGRAGWRLMIVLSGSMQPAFDTGALVVVRDVDPNQILKGDIITFQESVRPGPLITHRVIAIKKEKGSSLFVTKGDANPSADFYPVPGENIVGRVVWAIPWLGFIAGFLQSGSGLILLTACCALLTVLVFWPPAAEKNKVI